MTRATRKSESPGAEPVLEAELPEGWMEAWLERNKDALAVMIREAREQVARGEIDTRSVQDIIADGERRYRARRAKR